MITTLLFTILFLIIWYYLRDLINYYKTGDPKENNQNYWMFSYDFKDDENFKKYYILNIKLRTNKIYTIITFQIFIKLSDNNLNFIFIPEGFGHGFYSLAKENYIIYSCTKYRDKKSEVGIKFDDPDLNIKWPGRKFILSNKDKYNLTFADFKKKFI